MSCCRGVAHTGRQKRSRQNILFKSWVGGVFGHSREAAHTKSAGDQGSRGHEPGSRRSCGFFLGLPKFHKGTKRKKKKKTKQNKNSLIVDCVVLGFFNTKYMILNLL